MMIDNKLPKRKPTRWSEIDYSTEGLYFITICTHQRKQTLATIVGEGLAPPVIKLTPCGEIAKQQLSLLQARFPNAHVDTHVIMPNHIHLILHLTKAGGASPSPTVSDIICAFKSLTTRLCNQSYHAGKLFQRSFYDHVIRSMREYEEIAQYIAKNPQTWREDSLYCEDNK
ncbi:MAG: transposase [Clostridia bacterium]|nr:transposase [Clostridia bacterium]